MKKLFLLTLAVVMVGCSSWHRDFNERDIYMFQPGLTTYQEARMHFGSEPVETLFLEDGHTMRQWAYTYNTPSGVKTKCATLEFDRDGKFVKIYDIREGVYNLRR